MTAGTIMHHSKLPLTTWFWAAYLMATHSNGISALQLQRQLALGSYKSAWLMGTKLRRSMVAPGRSALAGLGGAMWAMYQESVNVQMGMQVLVMIFIVVIIGGLGSVGGCFVGALLVGLTANYTGFLAPKLALGSNILLMVLVLLWRPRGLHPVAK